MIKKLAHPGLVIILVGITCFLAGAVILNIQDLVDSTNAESAAANALLISLIGALTVGGVVLLLIKLTLKVLAPGLKESVVSSVKMVAILTGREDRFNEASKHSIIAAKGLKFAATTMLLGLIAGLIMILANSLFSLTNTIAHQQEILKLADQNRLMQVQQRFEMTADSAARQLDEVSSILLDPDSSVGGQVYALRQAKRAMTAEVVALRLPESSKAEIRTEYYYPNISRVRNVIRQYMKHDRVGRTLKENGFSIEENNRIPEGGMDALVKLGPASTQLLRTLEELGAEVVDGDKSLGTIWNFQVENSPFDEPLRIVEASPQQGRVDLKHIPASDWKFCQIPYAFLGEDSHELATCKNPELVLAQLQGCRIHGWNMGGANARGIQLQGAHLGDIEAENSDFSYGQLSKSFIQNANLKNCWFESADIVGADLTGSKMHGTNLQFANLSGADLSACEFYYANFWLADLSGVSAGLAKFNGARGHESTWTGAHLQGVSFQNADLSNAVMHGAFLMFSNFQHANLRGAEMQLVDLSGTDMRGANLKSARLNGAYLVQTDLRGTNLANSDFSGRHALKVGGKNHTNFFGAALLSMQALDDWDMPFLKVDWLSSEVQTIPAKFLRHSRRGEAPVPGTMQPLSSEKELRDLELELELVIETNRFNFCGSDAASDLRDVYLDKQTFDWLERIALGPHVGEVCREKIMLNLVEHTSIVDIHSNEWKSRLQWARSLKNDIRKTLIDEYQDVEFWFKPAVEDGTNLE